MKTAEERSVDANVWMQRVAGWLAATELSHEQREMLREVMDAAEEMRRAKGDMFEELKNERSSKDDCEQGGEQ